MSQSDLWLDGRFWSSRFERLFCKPVALFVEVVERRLLPSFDNIEEEAEAVAKEAWESLMSYPGDPDECDPGAFAEQAQQEGVDYYCSLDALRQAVLNQGAVTLRHMFEQQLLFFYWKQILKPGAEQALKRLVQEEPNKAAKFLDPRFIKSYLDEGGINIEALSSWNAVDELRLVANAIKHGEGKSAVELRKNRPDMFMSPSMRKSGDSFLGIPSCIYSPAAGEDLYVELEDLKVYAAAVQQFWREFGEVILKRSGQ